MFFNTSVMMAGIWLALGCQTGIWVNAFLLCIAVYTFQFTIFYSVSALVAVLTRSAIVCILTTLMMWGFLVVVGWTHWFIIEKGRSDKTAEATGHWAFVAYDSFHNVLPRYKDLDWLTSKEIQRELQKPRPLPQSDKNQQQQKTLEEANRIQEEKLDKDYGAYTWAGSLGVSSLFIVSMLALASWRFATRDY